MPRYGWILWSLLAVLGFAVIGVLYVTAPWPTFTQLLAPAAELVRRAVAVLGGQVERAQAIYPALRAAQPADLEQADEHAAASLAAFGHESNFFGDLYNYYEGGKLKRAHRAAREPLMTARDPWAVGICQITPITRKNTGLSVEDCFDPATNVQGWVGYAGVTHWKRILRGAPGASLIAKAALLYMGQGRGGGAMDYAIPVIGAGGSWSDACAAVDAHMDRGGLNYGNMWSTAQAAPAWLARLREWDGAA